MGQKFFYFCGAQLSYIISYISLKPNRERQWLSVGNPSTHMNNLSIYDLSSTFKDTIFMATMTCDYVDAWTTTSHLFASQPIFYKSQPYSQPSSPFIKKFRKKKNPKPATTLCKQSKKTKPKLCGTGLRKDRLSWRPTESQCW